MNPVIAVLIPCHNEEAAIGKVVQDFLRVLPEAAVFVYDNNSSDQTCAAAPSARVPSCVMSRCRVRGMSCVACLRISRRTYFVLVDGDDTYDAASAPQLIELLVTQALDMVNGARVASSQGAYRAGHEFGNALLTGLVAHIFGNRLTDMLSGYRVFSRRFIKSFPALTAGFEIETEFTVHALQLRMPIAEVPTPYRERPVGSVSKLRTYRDGWRILRTIMTLIKQEKPLQFFSVVSAVLALISAGLAVPLIRTYFATGLVPRLPTAVFSTGIMLLAFLSLVCGLVLETVTRGRKEAKRLAYLHVPIRYNPIERHESQPDLRSTARNADTLKL